MHLDALAEGVSQADVLDGQSQEMVLRYPERFWEWINQSSQFAGDLPNI